jgi:hypothetical protein
MTQRVTVAQALDRVLDSLERRMLRRERTRQSAENAVVSQKRNGGTVDARSWESYLVENARYNEARLAFNAAVEIDKACRPHGALDQ